MVLQASSVRSIPLIFSIISQHCNPLHCSEECEFLKGKDYTFSVFWFLRFIARVMRQTAVSILLTCPLLWNDIWKKYGLRFQCRQNSGSMHYRETLFSTEYSFSKPVSLTCSVISTQQKRNNYSFCLWISKVFSRTWQSHPESFDCQIHQNPLGWHC